MGHYRDKKVTAFSSRLNGKADLCDLVIDCPGCKKEVSFKEKIILYQLIKGLADPDIQARVLQAGAQVEGGELSLTRVMKLTEALKMAKTNQELISAGSAGLYRLSDHPKKKHTGRQDKRDKPKNNKPPRSQQSGTPTENKCGYCGGKGHTSKLSKRREKCPAFAKTWGACGTVGHFQKSCKGGPGHRSKSRERRPFTRAQITEVRSAEPTTPEAELSSLHGSWFLINGHLSTLKNAQQGRRNPHQAFINGKWSNSRLEDPGRVRLHLEVCHRVAKSQGFKEPRSTKPTTVIGLADTGAQMCVSGMDVTANLGLQRTDLIKPQLKISVADNTGLELIGAAFIFISGPNGATS